LWDASGVLERFSDGARAVVYLAIKEANELGRDCADVEHVLLGLLAEEGAAAKVLRKLDVTTGRVRARLLQADPPSAEGPSPQGPFPLPLTARAQTVLELALREALSYGSRFVGTEHILLGLVEHDGVAARILLEFDVDSAKIRAAIPAPLGGRRIVVGEPGSPLGVRVGRIGARDRSEGGGERADRIEVVGRPAEQQPVAGSGRVSDRLDPAAAGPYMTCVHATVKLQSSFRAELAAKRTDQPGEPQRLVRVISGNGSGLSVDISLSAQDSTGRRIHTAGRDFGIGGPRRGIWHRWHGPPLPDDYEQAARIMMFEHRVDVRDIEDGINQMLGRDPSLHHPPRLAWQGLIQALEQAGVPVTERELIDAPLTVELTPEVQAELERAT
jgi:hypothetical protein